VWAEEVQPLLGSLSPNVREICEYAFTEILNNANEHSGAPTARVIVRRTAAEVRLWIEDEGIGVFRKIKEACHLEDERHAVLELTKGKVTTDPERHSGEGIFFTSRMVDYFELSSGTVALLHARKVGDWLFQDAPPGREGTVVTMAVGARSKLAMKDVFDQNATERDDYAFRRTQVAIKLAQAGGGGLISRSQAKRIMSGLDKFKEVILDFSGIASIGPAFADEMFRVWATAHAAVELAPINMSKEVAKMVRRVERPAPAGASQEG
jgi:anti-sigma regulatory factor (Ser/Thr protein kinase)